MAFFESRIDAARRLAKALAQYRGRNPLVLAIPRGAVPMGRVLADELEGELEVVLARKVRSPASSGFASCGPHLHQSFSNAFELNKEKEAEL
jgi:putative phosphoribosyl transferase